MVSVKEMQVGRKYLVDGDYKILRGKKEYPSKLGGRYEAYYDLTFYDPDSGIETVSKNVEWIDQYEMDHDFYEPTCSHCVVSGGKKTRRKMKKRKPRKSRKTRKSRKSRKSRRKMTKRRII